MMWIGLFVGAVVGWVWDGGDGALVGGFLGWLAGIIIQSRRHSRDSRHSRAGGNPAQGTSESTDQRLARLERTVAELQSRLAKLEPTPFVAASPPFVESTPPPIPAEEPSEAAPAVAAEAPREQPSPSVELPPSKPNPIVAWLTGGNAIARVGLLILFFGLAFLLKYAADQDMLPVELRVGAVALGGIALLVVGWRLRESRRGYALGLQGAGVAVLYLTTFGALRLYNLLPAEAAFFLLAAIAALSAYIAVKQDSQVLAGFAAGGGFMAPILASTGAGSHVALFSYYLLLNAGIAGIAFFKAWRPLNLMGFLFTFFIGLAWGWRSYQPAHFDTTEPFLIAFFVMYVLITVLYARRQAPELRHPVDATLAVGVPLAAFGLQAALMRNTEFGLAFSALAAAWLYIGLSAILKRTQRPYWTLLSEVFLALGVVFATAAIPLALDARWTSATWALEGAAVVWVGIRQRRTAARAFGLLLQGGAGVAFFQAYRTMEATIPLADAAFVGALLLGLAGLWTHRLLLASREDVSSPERALIPIFFAWGLLWWLFAGHHEIRAFLARADWVNAHVAWFAGSALLFGALGLRWAWSEAKGAARLLLPALVVCALWSFVELRHPFARFGWLAWTFAIAVHFWILAKVEPAQGSRVAHVLHAGGMVLLAALGAAEVHWLAATGAARHTAWSAAGLVVLPAVLMLLAASRWADERWPVAAQRRAYRVTGAGILTVALALWSLGVNVLHAGASEPLPYLPLLNAIDLGHGVAAAAIVATILALRRTGEALPALFASRQAAAAAGIITFIWLNGVLLRTLHHWAGVRYDVYSISRSVFAQASLSIFWSILALALMVFAARRAWRGLWMVGAGLMAVVVGKLFLVDLSNVGGIERIVSFIAVGVLMLVIGYLSPVPPRQGAAKKPGPMMDDDEVRPEPAP